MVEEFAFLNVAGASNELAIFREYAYDFAADSFLLDEKGQPFLVEGNAALEIWIRKMLKTQRNKFLAYSNSYGFDGKELIGRVMSFGERRSEFKRFLIDALLVNPYIKSVDSVEFSQAETRLDVEIILQTIYGKLIL